MFVLILPLTYHKIKYRWFVEPLNTIKWILFLSGYSVGISSKKAHFLVRI